MAASRELHAGASSYRRPSADLMGNKDWLPVCASAFTANASGGASVDVRHPSLACACTTYGCMRMQAERSGRHTDHICACAKELLRKLARARVDGDGDGL